MVEVGFEKGRSCGVVFYHKDRDISWVVHEDDFVLCGLQEDLQWMKDLMQGWFEIKVRAILGQDLEDAKEVVILGRIVRWTTNGIEYEAVLNIDKWYWIILDLMISLGPFNNGERMMTAA